MQAKSTLKLKNKDFAMLFYRLEGVDNQQKIHHSKVSLRVFFFHSFIHHDRLIYSVLFLLFPFATPFLRWFSACFSAEVASDGFLFNGLEGAPLVPVLGGGFFRLALLLLLLTTLFLLSVLEMDFFLLEDLVEEEVVESVGEAALFRRELWLRLGGIK